MLSPLRSSSDVLLLLDCCCAMSIFKGSITGITHEVIGASGADSRAPVRSFTPAVCKILKESPENVGLSGIQIHNLLVHDLKVSPVHSFLTGEKSIFLIPTSSSVQTLDRHLKEVVVCIHLSEDLPPRQVDEFLEFLAKHPLLTQNGYVKLLETHKTNSTIILAIIPVYLASLLSRVMDVSFLYLVQ